MFMVSFLTFLYGFICVFTVFLVLLQRGKSSMGLGNLGGSNQALFGSSGGQDIFQKITWACLVIILTGSLGLSVLKGRYGKSNFSSYLPKQAQQSAPTDENAE
ncbi:MAG: preprotein translocase subunit SecG [Epsilonproteobacteria bacterium]|nr:preprotein translocase subunit SecG [Campylobacterota bacterium]